MDSLSRLARDFDTAGDELGQHADKLVRASTLRTEALGKAGAPVRTGMLRSSITSEFDGGPGSSQISGKTGPDTDYDVYVHNGTSRQPPNPFMDRAFDAVEPQFLAGAEAVTGNLGATRG